MLLLIEKWMTPSLASTQTLGYTPIVMMWIESAVLHDQVSQGQDMSLTVHLGKTRVSQKDGCERMISPQACVSQLHIGRIPFCLSHEPCKVLPFSGKMSLEPFTMTGFLAVSR